MTRNPPRRNRIAFQIPRAVYVHVPFCAHRCGYCNFTVVANRGDLIERYLAALERELSWFSSPAPVDTLYVGGGTPTQLDPTQLERLLGLVTQWFPLGDNPEFTVEANPEEVNPARIAVLSAAGVNRLSLGVQSLHPGKLRRLDRHHSPSDVVRAVELTRTELGNVAIDLIFAAPEETVEDWRRDLHAALRLEPAHVSIYGLTYERGTLFWNRRRRGRLRELDDECQRTMYELGLRTLAEQCYEHYEISNFARPGRRSRHNDVYWSGRTYFGVGPGASRYVEGVRETNHRSTTTYIKRVLADVSPTVEREQLDEEARARERLVFSLRRLAGVDCRQFRQDTGYDVESLGGEMLDRHIRNGFLEHSDGRLRLTLDGLLVSDSIWPDLI